MDRRDTRDERGREETRRENRDMNRDPITKEPGSHPVGTGVGGAAGAAAGAAIGAPFGPIGALIGGAIGAVAGGAAGHAAGEMIDPTAETEYWKREHRTRPYYDGGYEWDRDYAPAYRYGWESRAQHRDRKWDEAAPELRNKWETSRGESRMDWDQAQHPARDAWERTDRTYRAYGETDTHWRDNHRNRDYHDPNLDYESDYRPAYHYGTWARSQFADRAWTPDLENELGQTWETRKGKSRLEWDRAKHAVRDEWQRREDRNR